MTSVQGFCQKYYYRKEAAYQERVPSAGSGATRWKP